MRLHGRRSRTHQRRSLPARIHSGERHRRLRSEEHTSESSHTVISYAVFCLKKKKIDRNVHSLFHENRALRFPRTIHRSTHNQRPRILYHYPHQTSPDNTNIPILHTSSTILLT